MEMINGQLWINCNWCECKFPEREATKVTQDKTFLGFKTGTETVKVCAQCIHEHKKYIKTLNNKN
ncbi:hypothetical protein [Paenibacillus tyrfis]|uniref:hypothetical protein n=1 Tax=Paenibacillus tyrfis TaxID=1501230 RepID=UPI00209DE1E8|nr:hypothetical protein [Paenibacillus tyrfis]MCP1309846.1 hypothetical protein [Paenibacillus tyrfis]